MAKQLDPEKLLHQLEGCALEASESRETQWIEVRTLRNLPPDGILLSNPHQFFMGDLALAGYPDAHIPSDFPDSGARLTALEIASPDGTNWFVTSLTLAWTKAIWKPGKPLGDLSDLDAAVKLDYHGEPAPEVAIVFGAAPFPLSGIADDAELKIKASKGFQEGTTVGVSKGWQIDCEFKTLGNPGVLSLIEHVADRFEIPFPQLPLDFLNELKVTSFGVGFNTEGEYLSLGCKGGWSTLATYDAYVTFMPSQVGFNVHVDGHELSLKTLLDQEWLKKHNPLQYLPKSLSKKAENLELTTLNARCLNGNLEEYGLVLKWNGSVELSDLFPGFDALEGLPKINNLTVDLQGDGGPLRAGIGCELIFKEPGPALQLSTGGDFQNFQVSLLKPVALNNMLKALPDFSKLLEHGDLSSIGMGELKLEDALLVTDRKAAQVFVQLKLKDLLSLDMPDPLPDVHLKSVALNLFRTKDATNNATTVSGTIAGEAELKLGGIDFDIGCTYSFARTTPPQDPASDPNTWKIFGAVAHDKPLGIGSLVSGFNSELQLPEAIDRLTFSDLEFESDTEAKEHRFAGTCDDHFSITAADTEYTASASLHLDLTVKKDTKSNGGQQAEKYRYSGDFTTLLDVNGSDFEVKYSFGTKQVIRGHWQRENESTEGNFNLVAMGSSHGLNLEVLAELLQPEEVTLTIEIGETPDESVTDQNADIEDGNEATKPAPVRAGKLQLETVFEHLGDMTLMVAKRTDTPPAGKSSWVTAFGLTVPDLSSRDWPLDNLPLVGDALKSHALCLSGLRVLAANGDYGDDKAGGIMLGGERSPVHKGMQFSGTLVIENTSVNKPFEFNMIQPHEATTPAISGEARSVSGADASARSETTAPAVTETAKTESSSGLGKWFAIQKTIGPIEFERVGLEFRQKRLWLLLDAAMVLGPIRLGFDGLGVNFPLKDPFEHLGVALKGINITYANGPLEISGGLLDLSDETQIRFDGTATIKAETFTLSALGSYAKPRAGGDPSLFLFAVLPTPLGGPPYFYVTGLAAGVGVNQKLKLPAVDQVRDFPLVKAAMADGGGEFKGATEAQGAMALMETSFEREVGQMWLAAGIRFTCFKQVEGFALLTVSFGKRLELSLMGICRAQMPSETPNPVALVELEFKVSVLPDAGLLAVEASLTPASYIFSKDCHLTGSFAFYVWFSGKYEGDFALTLGGYHPSFPIPDHYPRARPLGYQWNLGDLTIKGGVYFAMTPSALMAGGSYEALFHKGRVTGSLVARANFLIFWKPFHYEADVSVTISGSVDLFLGSVSFHVGVKLELWGPAFGGRATVDLSVVSFSIDFGAGRAPPPPLSWAEFDTAFLGGGVCGIRVGQGLVKDLSQSNHQQGLVPGTDDTVDWVINAEHFLLVLDTKMPAKKVTISWNKEKIPAKGDTRSLDDEKKQYASESYADGWTKDFGVSPVALGSDKFQPTLHIRLTREDGPFDRHTVDFVPMIKSAPKALWQARDPDSLPPKLESETLIREALMGYRIVPRVLKPDKTLPVSVGTLQTEIANRIRHFNWQPETTRGGEPAHPRFQQESFAARAVYKSTLDTLHAMGLCTELESGK